MTSRRWIAGLGAAVAFALFLALGKTLGRAPDPAWLLTMETAWVNHSTLIAWWLTWLGYAYVLGPVGIVLLVVAARSPDWRWRIALSLLALLLAWRGADFFQHVFARPRRLDWVVKHETAFSYPSSHAAIVTGFYLLWSLMIARSTLRFRAAAAAVLAVAGLGILWSRLALGAHYVTDILGGVLLGAAVVGALAAAAPINVFGGRPTSKLE